MKEKHFSILVVLLVALVSVPCFAQIANRNPGSYADRTCIKSNSIAGAAECFLLVNAVDKNGDNVQIRQGVQVLTPQQIDVNINGLDSQKNALILLRSKVVNAISQ